MATSGSQAEKEALLPTSVKTSQTEKKTDSKKSGKDGQTEKETASKASLKSSQTEKETAPKSSVKAIPTEKETTSKRAPSNPPTDLCGLEDDFTPCFDWSAPPRIKTTLASPEQQAKCRRLIDSILHKDTILGVRVPFDPTELIEVFVEVEKYFESERVLIEDVPFDVVAVGDIHGQLYDIKRVFDIFAKDGKPGYECRKYLFLGDYVDRGRQQLEVIVLLFCLKILYPDNFFLLRGNHEFVQQNYRYGFKEELVERFVEETACVLFARANECFSWMSICAIVGDKYFCAHAGVSPSGFTRSSLRELSKPIVEATEDVIIQDMVWSDPAVGLKGSVFNFHRGSSIYFGLDVLVHALTRVNCVALIRGHSVMNAGFDCQWGICNTVFTATNTTNCGNDGSVLSIDENGKFKIYILKMDQKRFELETEWFGDEDADETTVRDDCGTGEAAKFSASGEYDST